MATDPTYTKAMATYATQVRNVFAPPKDLQAETPAASEALARGEALPTDFVAERAGALADTTEQAGLVTVTYLEKGLPEEQEAAELKLLAQASAQVRIARELIKEASEQAQRPAAQTAQRGVRMLTLQEPLDDLAAALEMPLSVPKVGVRAIADRPKDPAAAKADLKREVETSLQKIVQQSSRVGAQAVASLFKVDTSLLKQGVAMVSKDLADTLDKLISGATTAISNLLKAGARLLLQAYDWVLALLGQDQEQKMRVQVAGWIEQLKSEQGDNSTLVATLVDNIYTPGKINQDVAGWLEAAQVEVEPINQAAETVQGLGALYLTKTTYAKKLLDGIGLVRSMTLIDKIPQLKALAPQLELVLTAVTLGVLGYILYTGYDHVDSGRVQFSQRFGVNIPDRVVGVRATVQKALGARDASQKATLFRGADQDEIGE